MFETEDVSRSELSNHLFSETDKAHFPTVSDDLTLIFQWIFSGVMCLIIALFGTTANIIIIICFVKQGFTYPVNISFVGLAVSDIGCLVTLFWTNLCYTPSFVEADLPFNSMELQYLTSAMPHTAFTRITSWITAFITLERCLCITYPLKVKLMITREKVIIIMICTFIINFASACPSFVVNRLGMKFFVEKNKTLIGLLYTEDREIVETISYGFNNVLIPFSSFIVVIVCTLTLVIQLNNKSNWRKKSAISSQVDVISNRNRIVAKLVLIISFLFISCFIPISFVFIAMAIEPEFSIAGIYKNYFTIFGGLCMMLESINSSGNIFIYYHMSQKFRIQFQYLLCSSNKQITLSDSEKIY